MPSPIIDKFNEFNKSFSRSFHMPGHKSKKEFIPDDLFSFDITEIYGFDNLHNPTGIIEQSEKFCARLFGSDRCFYLVNGSTSGIMAAIASVVNPGDKILVSRNCHKSVYNALVLSHTIPVYAVPEGTFFGTMGVVSPEMVRCALEEHPDIKAAVITSPNYEGLCADVKSIAEILHKKNIPLIVDEAHGAHFAFSDEFPKDALSLGGDIVIQSLHKTLPVLTQCAVLHIKGNIVDVNRVKEAVSMFTTTSPSYIFLAVMDNCQNVLSERSDEIFERYVCNLKNFYEEVSCLKNLKIITKNDIIRCTSSFDFDFGKIILLIDNKNVINVEKSLRKYYNINIEMNGTNHILFMTSVCNVKEDFDALKNAVFDIDSSLSDGFFGGENIFFGAPVVAVPPCGAFYSKKEKVFFEDSMGLVSGEFIIPYPPGIPLVVPGEVITLEIIERVKALKLSGVEMVGCEDFELDTVNVIF